MEPQLVAPGVHWLEFKLGHVYLWDWGGSLTVVDTGIAGSAAAILRSVAAIESVRKLAGLDFEVACFGHGPPLVSGAGRRIRALAEGLCLTQDGPIG